MKLTSFIVTLTTIMVLSSCYSYQAFEPESLDQEKDIAQVIGASKMQNIRDPSPRATGDDMVMVERSRSSNKNKEMPEAVVHNETDEQRTGINLKTFIQPKEFYRLDNHGTIYKIEAKKWEGDTLHAIVKGKPKKELKFHENEISDLKIRKFSKGKSDMITIAAYALGGVGLFILLK